MSEINNFKVFAVEFQNTLYLREYVDSISTKR
jgi:hypothetical protein